MPSSFFHHGVTHASLHKSEDGWLLQAGWMAIYKDQFTNETSCLGLLEPPFLSIFKKNGGKASIHIFWHAKIPWMVGILNWVSHWNFRGNYLPCPEGDKDKLLFPPHLKVQKNRGESSLSLEKAISEVQHHKGSSITAWRWRGSPRFFPLREA